MQKISKNTVENLTGTVVPLGALYTKKSSVIGEYTSLKELRGKSKTCYFVICKLKLNDKVKEYYNGSLLT